MYDLSKVVTGDVANALAGNVPIPGDKNVRRAYHDFYAAWHPDSEEDRFYGGGAGGYYVYDISDIENPELRVTLTGINGVSYGHTFTPGPNGRYVIAETEYKYAPLRIFDLQPALDGERSNISQPFLLGPQIGRISCITTRSAGPLYSFLDTWTVFRYSA